MGTRPRTKLVLKRKSRRCSKCGGKLAPNAVRCRRCHSVQPQPTPRHLG